jgi:hypothetical protein
MSNAERRCDEEFVSRSPYATHSNVTISANQATLPSGPTGQSSFSSGSTGLNSFQSDPTGQSLFTSGLTVLNHGHTELRNSTASANQSAAASTPSTPTGPQGYSDFL